MADKIGDRIKQRRLSMHMTMDELAAKTGYDTESKKTAIYQIETGNNRIRVERLSKFAEALQTSIYYLLGMTEHQDVTDEHILNIIDKEQASEREEE